MNNREELELRLKELKLKKRELVLANKNTDKIDKDIKNIEIEIELLSQLLKGYSVNEISKRRNRSIKTVSCQKMKLYKNLT